MALLDRSAYGRRLLPSVLDELSRTKPHKLYGAIPKSADVTDGFRDITMSDMGRCVSFMASWIERRYGRSDSFETITYVGIADFRGVALFHAAVKCGYKLLLPSPRNPPATNVSLMNQTSSTTILYATEVLPLINQIQKLQSDIRSERIPSFDEMLNSNPEHYPYEKDFDKAKNDPIIVLHSSGSTGLPKPITITHSSVAVLDNEKNLLDIPGRKKRDFSLWNFGGDEARIYSVYPFFHLSGFIFFIVNPVLNNASLVLGPPHLLPDANLLRNIRLHNKLRAVVIPPSVVEQILHEPNGIEVFKDIDILVSGGAPLSPAVGDKLMDVVPLFFPFGSTEIFLIPELILEPSEWAWHEFHPSYKHEMQPYDPNEGTFELVVFADEDNKDTTALYHNLPGVTEYRTKDLFTQHPEKPKLFKFHGRRDDIIVLANGEKVNPIPLESNVQSHLSLKGVLVVGNGRTQAALLVEPRNSLDETGRTKLLNEIWPLIEESNSFIAGQGRIQQDKVLCAVPGKPFSRTGKQSVIRKLSEAAYKDEIEQLYSESSSLEKKIELKPTLKPIYEIPIVIEFLRDILAISFAAGATIGEDDDFFVHGLDSLQTLEIVSNLKRNLRDQTSSSVGWITPRTIFLHSTLSDLAHILTTFLNHGAIPNQGTEGAQTLIMDEIVERYAKALPRRVVTPTKEPHKTSKVALLGSTGFLGLYVVQALLKNPDITRIYCLNRSSDAQKRQEAALLNLDKSLVLLFHKLEYMRVEVGKPYLGLTKREYETLASEVDIVAYNAWRLDFGLSIRSFEPFIRAVSDIVELSVASKRNMRVLFVSSLSSVGNLAKKTRAPEAPVEDPSAALNIGYGQSKLASERILTAANKQCGVPVSIVRVGQVGGTQDGSGVWGDQPWISAIVRTARTLKCVPRHVARVDWVPVDVVGAMLHDFIVHEPGRDAEFFHVYPPKPQSWELFVDVLLEKYGITETAPFREWVNNLRNVPDPTAEDVTRMPALKLLDYYEALGDGIETIECETASATRVSKARIPVVDHQMLSCWLSSWVL